MFEYIDPNDQLPKVDVKLSSDLNVACSIRVMVIYKGRFHCGYFYYDLNCWRLDNGLQPETVDYWAIPPQPIYGVNVKPKNSTNDNEKMD